MFVMTVGCAGCRDGKKFEQSFSMAFQPIVNLKDGSVFAQEALVRGSAGDSAYSVLSSVTEENRYAFDQQCRVKAIQLASHLGSDSPETKLSINFMPNAVYEPRACIRLTLATAEQFGFPLERIIFEFTEDEQVDTDHLLNILRTYKDIGFKTAIDDFGAGYSGLNLLSKFQPDIVKLDMALIRNIDQDPAKRIIVRHTLAMLEDFGIMPVCEGVETAAELEVLRDLGVVLVQGYIFSRPSFESFTKPQIALAA
jgi:EAL domain-containing protein (putative c-di-GMP-specific phosphodiesterase class I)